MISSIWNGIPPSHGNKYRLGEIDDGTVKEIAPKNVGPHLARLECLRKGAMAMKLEGENDEYPHHDVRDKINGSDRYSNLFYYSQIRSYEVRG